MRKEIFGGDYSKCKFEKKWCLDVPTYPDAKEKYHEKFGEKDEPGAEKKTEPLPFRDPNLPAGEQTWIMPPSYWHLPWNLQRKIFKAAKEMQLRCQNSTFLVSS